MEAVQSIARPSSLPLAEFMFFQEEMISELLFVFAVDIFNSIFFNLSSFVIVKKNISFLYNLRISRRDVDI